MYKVILFTNRNLLVFDKEGKQTDYQDCVDCYNIDEKKLKILLNLPAEYYICRWGEWQHQISKREFEYLLGQRTREKDIQELKQQKAAA